MALPLVSEFKIGSQLAGGLACTRSHYANDNQLLEISESLLDWRLRCSSILSSAYLSLRPQSDASARDQKRLLLAA